MAIGYYLQAPRELCVIKSCLRAKSFQRAELKRDGQILNFSPSFRFPQKDFWVLQVSRNIRKRTCHLYGCNVFKCKSFAFPDAIAVKPTVKAAALALKRLCTAMHSSPVAYQLVPGVGVIFFTLWGLGPLLRLCRQLFFNGNDSTWRRSRTQYIYTSFLQPLLLWCGATLVCRALDPVVLPSEASQAIKQRVLTFIRSLSTVMAFAVCLSSFIQKTQNFFQETSDPNDTRNMGFQFAGKAIYTAVWVGAFSLFMELLGFSTQKWLTAGGLGTVLLTLAGREIFTNFLSSVMIHATRPFILNEWIQTKIEGYEVSGTVEHVGWWSPTIIRGDDREAVHIPNHKFTVSVVRNLSQKTHWRIKTHIAVSHLDVDKISNIVADMRKVLAKNPQVEQQKLHRRVFLDNVDRENQALLILISCFVKTSHFEEYLCVKETILLDLLRVIRHHRARLATPIRTVQKFYGADGGEMDNIPFTDSIFSRPGSPSTHSLLLIEPPPPKASPNSEEEKPLPKPAPSKQSPREEAPLASPPSPVASSRPSLEENLVLGVALDGAKRTLPIEEGMGKAQEKPNNNPGESKELAPLLSGSKDKEGPAAPPATGPTVEVPRDQQER